MIAIFLSPLTFYFMFLQQSRKEPSSKISYFLFDINTTADFFCHSRENGNPACLRASKPQLDTRFRGYDGRGGSTFCWYSAVLFQRVAVVLIY
jgi:hypothetical protein